MTWHEVDAPADAPDGTIHPVAVGTKPIALIRSLGRWHAVDDDCTHSECPFSEYGELFDDVSLCCLCHGSEFHLETGEVLADPATEPLRVHRVNEADGRVSVELPD